MSNVHLASRHREVHYIIQQVYLIYYLSTYRVLSISLSGANETNVLQFIRATNCENHQLFR